MTESRKNKLKKKLEWKRKEGWEGQGHDPYLLYLNKQNKINWCKRIPIKGEVPEHLSILFKKKKKNASKSVTRPMSKILSSPVASSD